MNNNEIKSKMVTYAMTGALSLGIIGGTIIPTYAATVQKETVNVEEYKKLDAETQQRVNEILNNLRKELAELGISFPTGKGDKLANLDDETRTKVQEIMKQVEDGSLTQEEVDTQLKELGVSLSDHKFMRKGDKLLANLDDETRTKVQEIMKQVEDGSLTQEEADTQLKELGVSIPNHNFMRKGDKLANLDDETKKEVTKLIEKAKVQMEELGVYLPTKFNQLID